MSPVLVLAILYVAAKLIQQANASALRAEGYTVDTVGMFGVAGIKRKRRKRR